MGCEEKPFYIKGSFVGWEGMPEMGCGLSTEGIKGVRALSLVDEAEMEARATEEASRASVRDDKGVACYHGGDWRVSEAFPTESRVLLTDEALTAEASRGTSGLDETVDGVGYRALLCAVLKDGSLWVMDSVEEKSKDNNMSDVVEVMQERANLGNKWDESSLVKFNKSLGFSTEGVEREILKLLLRLKTRRDQGKKKRTLRLTRGGAEPRGGGDFWSGELWMPGCSWRDGFRWTFSGVYGPTLRKYREVFWEELGAIRGLWNDPWCIGGDFNMIRGGAFTWSGGLNNQTMSRIDRFLVTEDWEGYFNGVVQSTLPRPVSDHFPSYWMGEGGAGKLRRGRGGGVGTFKNLLTDPGEWHPSMNGLDFNRIDGEEAARLEEAFTKEDVFSALSDMNEDKAPGPDGFSLSFWQFSWEFVKVEVMGFFKEFHEHGRFVKSLNSTFLVLIPKKAGTEDLRDFKPISLVRGLYKLLAKVLANRLKKVVGKVVPSAQNAFVEGRQILNAALIANEAIDSMLKRNESGVLCKLDIEKAYDHLNWNFLLSVLQRMGFGEKWFGWISWCISTATFSVLINGTPEGFFNSSRGVSFRLQDKGRRGDGALVSHLLFADDTLVFCDTFQDQMAYLSWLLMWFEAISGLRINLDKSEILSVGRVENLELLAHEVGCKVGRLPTSYLGIPLGANHKSVAVWDGVEERVVSLRLEKIQRDFLWGGGALERKPYLVNWDTVCLDKRKGGLGVRRLSTLNKALLCKWNWCFANERDTLWRCVISMKFGKEERGGILKMSGRALE
ncbi:LINE-1 retrotransposable element ORF2 protein [Vitis vinifera]|uniref:LINE-1 retrotransposable element ORF2 protein n=1 Tax=Vitis vinifera TaxID=29760 RepID=A0A438K7M9_VITVI|nr:LINE-1 retrotransposable element ORF2 protein [Vitis vinifera]